jgi:hypothetical protein
MFDLSSYWPAFETGWFWLFYIIFGLISFTIHLYIAESDIDVNTVYITSLFFGHVIWPVLVALELAIILGFLFVRFFYKLIFLFDVFVLNRKQ